MSTRKVLKGASFLSLAEVVSQGSSLLRNIILARFLTKADFGVAAMLGMILTVFEMTGKMALGQQVVQSKHAEEPSFINGAHFTQLALSVLSAVLILIFAWPMAHFFAGPEYLATIMTLASIPFINGFTNLNLYTQTRKLSFGPLVLADMIPQVISTLAAWPLAAYFHDYRAVLCLLVGRSALYTLMTHLLAKSSFRPKFNAHWLKESLKFGWPLLLSGFIQYGNFQGDSTVIAAGYSLTQLGEFSAALTIAMAPGLTLIRVSTAVSLPLLSDVQDNLPNLLTRYSHYAELMALLSCSMMLGMLFCAEHLIVLLFGMKYSGIGPLACWLTGAQALRIMRNVVGSTAMARGDTVNNLVSSSWRLSGLVLAIGVGFWHASLIWFAVAGIVGEIIALWAVILRLKSKHQIGPIRTITPTVVGLLPVLIGVAIKWALPISPYSWFNWLLMVVTIGLSAVFFMARFPELRVLLLGYAAKLNNRFGSPLPVAWLPNDPASVLAPGAAGAAPAADKSSQP